MKRPTTIDYFRGIFLLAALALFPLEATADTRPVAVASISIIGDMVRAVGGERISVENLVHVGGDPHTYDQFRLMRGVWRMRPSSFAMGLDLSGGWTGL